MKTPEALPGGDVVVYQAPDGEVRVDVRLERETVWLRQEQMAELFGRERSVITKHLRNVFKEGELDEESNVHFLHIAGSDKPVGLYSADRRAPVAARMDRWRGVDPGATTGGCPYGWFGSLARLFSNTLQLSSS